MRWDPYPPPSRGQALTLSLRERGSELRAGSPSEAGPQAIRYALARTSSTISSTVASRHEAHSSDDWRAR